MGDLLLRCEQLLAETEPGTLWEQRLQGFRAMLVLEQGDRENARAAFERMREISSDLGWIGTEHSMDEALVDEVNRLTTPN